MRILKIILALFILLLSSCDKEETAYPVYLYAPIIHGYMQTDYFGNFEKLIGSDDTKPYDNRLDSIKYPNQIYLNIYPNPCSDYLYLNIGGQGLMKKIWIVPARASDGLLSYLNANCLVVQGQPVYSQESVDSYIGIDFRNFKYNYYRIYVKIYDILLWNNIVKQ